MAVWTLSTAAASLVRFFATPQSHLRIVVFAGNHPASSDSEAMIIEPEVESQKLPPLSASSDEEFCCLLAKAMFSPIPAKVICDALQLPLALNFVIAASNLSWHPLFLGGLCPSHGSSTKVLLVASAVACLQWHLPMQPIALANALTMPAAHFACAGLSGTQPASSVAHELVPPCVQSNFFPGPGGAANNATPVPIRKIPPMSIPRTRFICPPPFAFSRFAARGLPAVWPSESRKMRAPVNRKKKGRRKKCGTMEPHHAALNRGW